MLISVLSPAALHGGRHASSAVAPASYGYISAPTSWPAARAESIRAMTIAMAFQLRGPAALRW